MEMSIWTEFLIMKTVYKNTNCWTVYKYYRQVHHMMKFLTQYTFDYGFWLCADQRYTKELEPEMAKLTPLLIKIMKYGILKFC